MVHVLLQQQQTWYWSSSVAPPLSEAVRVVLLSIRELILPQNIPKNNIDQNVNPMLND
jgi:hypothetical protein